VTSKTIQNVAFLPGMLADERLWEKSLPFITNNQTGLRLRPHFIDMAEGESIGHIADQVLRQMPHRFALVGMSMGGYVALEIMRRSPGRISHMMLVNTRACAESAVSRRKRVLMARMIKQQSVFRGFNGPLLDGALHPDNRHQTSLLKVLEEMAASLGRDVFCRQQIAVANRADYFADLAHITIPCHVMWGQGDAIIPPKLQLAMAQKILHATFQEIPGAGHYVPLEAPEIFANGLMSLLAC